VHERHYPDLAATERAIAGLLVALGRDPADEHLVDTPGRVARAYAELLTPREFELTTFPNDEGYDELVLARDIPVHSLCQHHLLPFHGVAHVGYLPGTSILGLSKLARVVELFARDLQVQERLATAPPHAQGRGCRHRGRTPVHVTARRPGRRVAHRHVGATWSTA
jgi:GTP cyclohydrolase I